MPTDPLATLKSTLRPVWRLGADPRDLTLAGLRTRPEAWEDGRRTRWQKEEYEWWYFDAHFDDGSAAVGSYAITYKDGAFVHAVRISITEASGKTHTTVVPCDPGDCAYLCGGADVTMGPHRLVGGLDSYRIVADPAVAGLGWDLTLTRRVLSYRPASGFLYGGEHYFAWINPVPDGLIEGTITYNGQTRTVSGSGYHDHNWGDASMGTLMSGWTWGRVKVGDLAVVAADVRPHARLDGNAVPLMLVTGPTGELVNAFCEAVAFEAGPTRAHPDTANRRDRLPEWVRFTATQNDVTVVATFVVEDLMESVDLVRSDEIGAKPWQVALATAAGMTPWYTRFRARVTVSITGRDPITEVGTIEFMDFT